MADAASYPQSIAPQSIGVSRDMARRDMADTILLGSHSRSPRSRSVETETWQNETWQGPSFSSGAERPPLPAVRRLRPKARSATELAGETSAGAQDAVESELGSRRALGPTTASERLEPRGD